ncbi:MAG TPA: type II secretion system protein [Thiobacillus sp.]|nr:type II secretion system protein [Thiobacillus sp.]
MKQARGFTLIELAIVLVIVTILIGGLAMPLSAQIQARRIAETKKILEEAREAIIGYAMSSVASSNSCRCTYTVGDTGTCPIALNSVTPATCSSLCPAEEEVALTLPSCPASGTGPLILTLPITRHYLPCPSNDGTGIESRHSSGASSGECIPCNDANQDNLDDVTGKRCNLLPWATLGAANQDSWGNRLHYGVIGTYADSNIGFASNAQEATQINDVGSCNGTFDGSGSSCTSTDVSDCYKQICGSANTTIAANVPVVLISYGPNGWGAMSVNEKILATPTGNDEKKNHDTNQFYVNRPPYKAADGSAAEQTKEFDDLVVWISDGLLKSRVCPAGGCP